MALLLVCIHKAPSAAPHRQATAPHLWRGRGVRFRPTSKGRCILKLRGYRSSCGHAENDRAFHPPPTSLPRSLESSASRVRSRVSSLAERCSASTSRRACSDWWGLVCYGLCMFDGRQSHFNQRDFDTIHRHPRQREQPVSDPCEDNRHLPVAVRPATFQIHEPEEVWGIFRS